MPDGEQCAACIGNYEGRMSLLCGADQTGAIMKSS